MLLTWSETDSLSLIVTPTKFMVEFLFPPAIGGSAVLKAPRAYNHHLPGFRWVEMKMLSGCPGCDMADVVLCGTGIARAD